MSIKTWFQKKLTGYHDNMWWDAFSYMSEKILPIMKQYQKADRQGFNPHFLKSVFPELPELNEIGSYKSDKDFKIYEEKYQWVLDEIVFALECCSDDDLIWKLCSYPNPNYDLKQKEPFKTIPVKNKEYVEIRFNNDYSKTNYNMDRMRELEKRIDYALELMGKFWRTLWD